MFSVVCTFPFLCFFISSLFVTSLYLYKLKMSICFLSFYHFILIFTFLTSNYIQLYIFCLLFLELSGQFKTFSSFSDIVNR